MEAQGLQTQEAAAVGLSKLGLKETAAMAVLALSLLPTRHRWHRCHQSVVV